MSTPPTPTKTRSNPSYYRPLQFYGVRTISAISSAIVTAILVSFCIELKNEKYNIPWTFLIVGFTSVISLAALVLTSLLHCCARLSPLFSLIINVPLLLLWLASLGLFTYNIYGTLSHSCSLTNWASANGVLICNQYKALFSFVVFGMLAQVAMITLDVRARRVQTRSGKYAKMDGNDVKLEPYNSVRASAASEDSIHDTPYTGGNTNAPYQYRDEQPGWRPMQRANTNHSQQEQGVMNNGYDYRSQHGDMGSVRMDDFRGTRDVYQRPTYQTYQAGHVDRHFGNEY